MLSSMARDAYIVDAVRSPIGRRNGSLSEIRADELAAQVLNGLVERVDVDPGTLTLSVLMIRDTAKDLDIVAAAEDVMITVFPGKAEEEEEMPPAPPAPPAGK